MAEIVLKSDKVGSPAFELAVAEAADKARDGDVVVVHSLPAMWSMETALWVRGRFETRTEVRREDD